MRRRVWLSVATCILVLPLMAQKAGSPKAETTATIGGKAVTIKYSAPSLRGRKVFGAGNLISNDPTYPVWRAGANAATALHTDADLDIGGLTVPKGDYTIFVQVDKTPWELIINKQTGQWGLAYDKSQDLGRVKMTMSKPAAEVETFKIDLTSTGAKTGKLQMEWADMGASVPIKVK